MEHTNVPAPATRRQRVRMAVGGKPVMMHSIKMNLMGKLGSVDMNLVEQKNIPKVNAVTIGVLQGEQDVVSIPMVTSDST